MWPFQIEQIIKSQSKPENKASIDVYSESYFEILLNSILLLLTSEKIFIVIVNNRL